MEKDLKEQLENIAIPAKETTVDASNMEARAALWLEDNPGFDMITMTGRPDNMPYELYTAIRRVAKRALKNYKRRI